VSNQRSFNSSAQQKPKGSTPVKTGTLGDLFAKAGLKK
jgi:hypothetical protein